MVVATVMVLLALVNYGKRLPLDGTYAIYHPSDIKNIHTEITYYSHDNVVLVAVNEGVVNLGNILNKS